MNKSLKFGKQHSFNELMEHSFQLRKASTSSMEKAHDHWTHLQWRNGFSCLTSVRECIIKL